MLKKRASILTKRATRVVLVVVLGFVLLFFTAVAGLRLYMYFFSDIYYQDTLGQSGCSSGCASLSGDGLRAIESGSIEVMDVDNHNGWDYLDFTLKITNSSDVLQTYNAESFSVGSNQSKKASIVNPNVDSSQRIGSSVTVEPNDSATRIISFKPEILHSDLHYTEPGKTPVVWRVVYAVE